MRVLILVLLLTACGPAQRPIGQADAQVGKFGVWYPNPNNLLTPNERSWLLENVREYEKFTVIQTGLIKGGGVAYWWTDADLIAAFGQESSQYPNVSLDRSQGYSYVSHDDIINVVVGTKLTTDGQLGHAMIHFSLPGDGDLTHIRSSWSTWDQRASALAIQLGASR